MKKVNRSRTDKVFAGICGGLAECFGFDSNVIRFSLVIATFFMPFMLVAYLAAAFIFPAASQVVYAPNNMNNNPA